MEWQQTNGKKFRKSDIEKLKNAVNRYNKKLSRITKKYQNEKNIVLPDRLYVKKLKEQIQTRSDLNNFYKSVDKFMERGSEQIVEMQSGVRITKYGKQNLESQIRIARRRLNKEIKNLELEQEQINKERKKKKKTNDDLENMYKFTTDELSKLRDNKESLSINILKKVKSENVRESLLNLINRANKFASETVLYKRKKIYKENYLKTMKEAFQYADKYDELKDKLEKITEEDFYKLIAFDDIVSDIKHYYQVIEKVDKYGGDDLDDLFERTVNSWEKVIKEKNLRLILKQPQTQTTVVSGRGLFAK